MPAGSDDNTVDHPGTGTDDDRRRRRAPGSLEGEILAVLHDSGTPLSPGEVRERLAARDDHELSYSAVVTTLSRLHAKGVVTRGRSGRAYRYAAPSDPSGLVAWRMSRLLDAEADHAPALTHFISGLSARDEELVRRLLLGDTTGDGTPEGGLRTGGPGAGG
ncbi:BlaI/MecI/CopY family transcriptional regulator [Polymorphospora sp. NPDC050346]|uniref:BlaI/MecI/CopY family transcriptional regulator n=1 Tax=Polymorphospora sp. NPDC050346 TaxID=3155780 RepID=UPI0033E58602